MPRGDRSGPMGMGPMTGRGAGYCAGSGAPEFANSNPGRGFGRGSGFGGRGWRNGFRATGRPGWSRFGGYGAAYSQVDPGQETQALRSQADALQSELDFIRKRLAEMEGSSGSE